MSTRLTAAQQDNVLILTLENDDGLPRLERAILRALSAEVEKFVAIRDLRGCVITGSERAFAVGADIAELASLRPDEAFEFSGEGQRVFRSIERSPKPIVAAIRGYCMGGGLDLALSCHARIATPDVEFAHPGGALGILTGWGGTQRLTRLVGRGRTLEMLTTGRKVSVAEAFEWGLINEIAASQQLLARACRRAILSTR